MAVCDYEQLEVWKRAMLLAEQIYRITRSMPADERFGLTSQIRRAAVSIPSNIAEGNARNTTRDYLQFLSIARGSLAELHTQLLLVTRLGYLPQSTETLRNMEDVRRLLQALIRALKKRLDAQGK